MRVKIRPLIAAVVLGIVVATTGVSGPAVAATSYPSWDDVQKARSNESAKKTEIDRVTKLIDDLRSKSAAAQEAAMVAADEYATAVAIAEEAELKSNALKDQLVAAQDKAAASAKQAGSLFAKMGRTNSFDVTATLLVNGEQAEDTLYKLGAISKLTELSATLLDEAKQDANQVSSLSDQADVAAQVLEEARAVAETKLEAANAAADAAAAAVAEQEKHEVDLLGQLEYLKGTTATVEAGYAAGVAARKAEEERLRKLAEEAAKNAASSGSNVGTSGNFWTASSQGWYRPVPGGTTSPYGPRRIICKPGAGCSTGFHTGLDFAGSSGQPIKAVFGGTVVSVGNAGGHGNRVIIDHGGGVQSHYGHIMNGGYKVSVGQQVAAGQVIALVGATGVVTGPHLDLKIYVNGNHTSPAPFLRARGVSI